MKLQWEDKYSVGVKVIDDQHKQMFEMINGLVDVLSEMPTKEQLDKIIVDLIEYKKIHFATEEKYFDQFMYENSEEHKAKHKEFNIRLNEIVVRNGDDSIT